MVDYEELKNELKEMAKLVKEFPDAVQLKAFESLLDVYLRGHPKIAADTKKSFFASQTTTDKKKSRSRAAGKESLRLIKDLDLKNGASGMSLREFVKEKDPANSLSARKFNTVAVYYLKKILEIDHITPSHVYTCYKEVNKPLPGAFTQSLFDTASKEGHIDTKNLDSINIALRGENFVEHELPNKKN